MNSSHSAPGRPRSFVKAGDGLRARNAGFTLAELLVTLSVAAVLMAAAIPTFRNFVADSRMSSAANLLVAHINAARSEAVMLGTPVAVCASADQATCSGDTDWKSGWIVFTDNDGDPGVLDGADHMLLASQPPGNDLSMVSENSYIRFDPLGRLSTR